MLLKQAMQLHPGDEVTCKETGETLCVVEVSKYTAAKTVFLLCDDGSEYHHTEIE